MELITVNKPLESVCKGLFPGEKVVQAASLIISGMQLEVKLFDTWCSMFLVQHQVKDDDMLDRDQGNRMSVDSVCWCHGDDAVHF